MTPQRQAKIVTTTEPSEGERLQKVLARIGYGSRRVCEDLITDGAVTVNGAVAVLGTRVRSSDEVAVDGTVVATKPDLVTYLLNKPVGVITTASDTHNRQIITDLVPESPRVFPVGRLDKDTEGLILMTNDGQLAHRLTHPRFGVAKEYLATVSSRPSRADLRALRNGVELDDGITAPATVSEVSPAMLKMVIHEGRNRQIRRMCEAVGCPVTRLVRTRIGLLVDRKLKPGQWRNLSRDELLRLQQQAHLAQSTD